MVVEEVVAVVAVVAVILLVTLLATVDKIVSTSPECTCRRERAHPWSLCLLFT